MCVWEGIVSHSTPRICTPQVECESFCFEKVKNTQKSQKYLKIAKTRISSPRKSILTSICRLSITLKKTTLQKHQRVVKIVASKSKTLACKFVKKQSKIAETKMHVEVDNMESEYTRWCCISLAVLHFCQTKWNI